MSESYTHRTFLFCSHFYPDGSCRQYIYIFFYLFLVYLLFGPAQIFTNQFVKTLIMFSKKFTQFGDDNRINMRMFATFCFAQTTVTTVIAQTVESFRFIKIKMIAGNTMFNACNVQDKNKTKRNRN